MSTDAAVSPQIARRAAITVGVEGVIPVSPEALTPQAEDLAAPFFMLTSVFGDQLMRQKWSEEAAIGGWLRFEAALAKAQAELGIIPIEAAQAIDSECHAALIDIGRLHERTRVVGYPILPLLEQLGERGDGLVDRFVHWGATTQDAMDTGLTLQIKTGLDRLQSLLTCLGDELVGLMRREADTLMVARTHAQHAVPTTFGAKLAVLVAEFGRHCDRLASLRNRVQRVSLFGAGGTGAAYGPLLGPLRMRVAELLGLTASAVPWHTARDSLAESVLLCALLNASCGKLGREVIELSRPEIAELSEGGGRMRGASSTMPQKANPIASEVLVGLAGAAVGYAQTAPLFMQAGHERSAGEWQIEWETIPAAFIAASSALHVAIELVGGLQIHRNRMIANLESSEGFAMAEGAMMRLAPVLGRHRAHTLVYDSCVDARARSVSLSDAIAGHLTALGSGPVEIDTNPHSYLGETARAVQEAIDLWDQARANLEKR